MVSATRRALLAAAAGVMAARGLATAALPRPIGVLHIWRAEAASARRFRAQLVATLRELGHRDGIDVSYVWRFAEHDFSSIPRLAAELVALAPHALVTQQSALTKVLSQLTASIPIISLVDDPAREGYAGPDNRPAGNVTGVADLFTERSGKMIEVLKLIMPRLDRFAVLVPVDVPMIEEFTALVAARVRMSGLEPVVIRFRNRDEISRAFRGLRQRGIHGAFPIYAWLHMNPSELAHLALDNGIATVAEWRSGARYGVVLSYDAQVDDTVRQQARFLDRVLRGARPAALPFEFPARYRLSINRRTLSALGLSIPSGVALRADELFDSWEPWPS